MAVGRVIELLKQGRFKDLYHGLVTLHEYDGFALLSYTKRCHSNGPWDGVTNICRGLMVDTQDWGVAALPFPKFFKLGERPETLIENLPHLPFLVTEKVDGSLGILWRDRQGCLRIATRGSFDNEQTRRAQLFLDALPNTAKIPSHLTLAFEIIYKENKTVLRYPHEGLVLLAVLDRYSQTELSFEAVRRWGDILGVRIPKVYPFGSLAEVRESVLSLPADLEGYVIRFQNNFRVKLKGKKYLDLFRIFFSFSEDNVLDALRHGSYDELAAKVPDELWEEAEVIRTRINHLAAELADLAMRSFREAPKNTRKEFALWIQQNVDPRIIGALYQLFDNKEVNWLELAIKIYQRD